MYKAFHYEHTFLYINNYEIKQHYEKEKFLEIFNVFV